MEEDYNKREPEKFTQFLRRQKVVFFVAFFGYVCAYLVRNNFKLMSNTIMVQNGWDKAQIATLLIVFDRFLWFSKILYGGLRGSC
ncbi:hypothetical protein Z183_00094 [Streptococcus pyogenes ABC020056894]|nr:hypothetical protein Z183_00094 [Streptococcus pyogenes ABC020056894]